MISLVYIYILLRVLTDLKDCILLAKSSIEDLEIEIDEIEKTKNETKKALDELKDTEDKDKPNLGTAKRDFPEYFVGGTNEEGVNLVLDYLEGEKNKLQKELEKIQKELEEHSIDNGSSGSVTPTQADPQGLRPKNAKPSSSDPPSSDPPSSDPPSSDPPSWDPPSSDPPSSLGSIYDDLDEILAGIFFF
jgi:hypothetical protein